MFVKVLLCSERECEGGDDQEVDNEMEPGC